MIYFLLWSFISTFLLGFWLWSSYVLYKQKTGWRAYAEKRKLRYEGGGFYESPKISGVMDGYSMVAFTGDHTEFDARLQRRLSGIEVSLHTCLPGQTVLATGGMVEIVSILSLPQEYKPEYKGWDDSYVIRSQDYGAAVAYFTPERMEALLSLTKIKNLWIVLVFLDGQGLLRVDLPDPVVEPKRLDMILKKMIEVASVLELKKGEDIAIVRKARDVRDSHVHKIKDEAVVSGLTLELEDEEFEATTPVPAAPETKSD